MSNFFKDKFQLINYSYCTVYMVSVIVVNLTGIIPNLVACSQARSVDQKKR